MGGPGTRSSAGTRHAVHPLWITASLAKNRTLQQLSSVHGSSFICSYCVCVFVWKLFGYHRRRCRCFPTMPMGSSASGAGKDLNTSFCKLLCNYSGTQGCGFKPSQYVDKVCTYVHLNTMGWMLKAACGFEACPLAFRDVTDKFQLSAGFWL